MTIPARIIVGMLVDKLDPRIMYTGIFILDGANSIVFGWANSYEQLAVMRFLSGFIGAGFVKPNENYLQEKPVPLMERNPVKF